MADPATSFARDIRPLFREKDVNSMKKAFDLSSYDDVRDHADAILQGRHRVDAVRWGVATGPGLPLSTVGPGRAPALRTSQWS